MLFLSAKNLLKMMCSTSIHVEEHEGEARDTKLGPEEITRDIPNVAKILLRTLTNMVLSELVQKYTQVIFL